MPNQVPDGHRRVSYVESIQNYIALKILAVTKGCSVSELLRDWHADIIKKCDQSGGLRKIAAQLHGTLDDETGEVDLANSPEVSRFLKSLVSSPQKAKPPKSGAKKQSR